MASITRRCLLSLFLGALLLFGAVPSRSVAQSLDGPITCQTGITTPLFSNQTNLPQNIVLAFASPDNNAFSATVSWQTSAGGTQSVDLGGSQSAEAIDLTVPAGAEVSASCTQNTSSSLNYLVLKGNFGSGQTPFACNYQSSQAAGNLVLENLDKPISMLISINSTDEGSLPAVAFSWVDAEGNSKSFSAVSGVRSVAFTVSLGAGAALQYNCGSGQIVGEWSFSITPIRHPD